MNGFIKLQQLFEMYILGLLVKFQYPESEGCYQIEKCAHYTYSWSSNIP